MRLNSYETLSKLFLLCMVFEMSFLIKTRIDTLIKKIMESIKECIFFSVEPSIYLIGSVVHISMTIAIAFLAGLSGGNFYSMLYSYF